MSYQAPDRKAWADAQKAKIDKAVAAPKPKAAPTPPTKNQQRPTVTAALKPIEPEPKPVKVKPEVDFGLPPETQARQDFIAANKDSVTFTDLLREYDKRNEIKVRMAAEVVTTLLDAEEFFNDCHGPDGKFCEGTGGPGSPQGMTPSLDTGGLAGPASGSSGTGPGSKAWLAAHGVSAEAFKSRPYAEWNQRGRGPNGPLALNKPGQEAAVAPLVKEYGPQGTAGEPDPYGRTPAQIKSQTDFMISKIAPQSAGLIMERNPVGGTENPYGPVLAEVRPNNPVKLDPGAYQQLQDEANAAHSEVDRVKGLTSDKVVLEAQGRLNEAEVQLDQAHRQAQVGSESGNSPLAVKSAAVRATDQAYRAAQNLTQEQVLANPNPQVSASKRRLDALEPGTPQYNNESAKLDRAVAIRKNALINQASDAHSAAVTDLKNLNKGVRVAEARVQQETDTLQSLTSGTRIGPEGKLIPATPLDKATAAAERSATQADNRLSKGAVKYVFPSGANKDGVPFASRVDIHQDSTNVHNMEDTKTNGRVIYAQEGVIKADALMKASQSGQGQPNESVISSASVTLWRPSEQQRETGAEGEVSWLTRTRLQGREVLMVNDADEVGNEQVRNEGRALQSLMRNKGAGDVLLAHPPTEPNPSYDPSKPTSKTNTERRVITVDAATGKPLTGPAEDFPKGIKTEQLKGADDALGVGREKLGDFTFTHREVPSTDLNSFEFRAVKRPPAQPGGRSRVVLQTGARGNIEQTQTLLGTISNLVGPKGGGKLSMNMLQDATGMTKDQVEYATKNLEHLGILETTKVFNPSDLQVGEKNFTPAFQAKKAEYVRKGYTGAVQESEDLRYADREPVSANTVYVIKDSRFRSIDYPEMKVSDWDRGLGPTGTAGQFVIRTQEAATRYHQAIGSVYKRGA